MTDTTYNGWTNRATWLVALWMNEEDFIGGQQHNRVSEISVKDVRAKVSDWVFFQREYPGPGPFGFIQDMDGEEFTAINYCELTEAFTHDINAIFED